jgi:HEPN domain-containing protein
MTKERRFKKEYAKELVKIAYGDLESAKGLFKVKMGRTENILFHVEQSIEKALKAVLCWLGGPVPVIHELGIIVARFPEGVEVPESDNMLDLSQFAAIRRYEEGVAQFSDEEITAAIDLAERTLAWANSQLK